MSATNLFARLQIHSGTVAGMIAQIRNQWEFIESLDGLEPIPTRQRVIAYSTTSPPTRP